MRCMMLVLLALALLACNKPLKSCPKGQIRGWCQVDVRTKTFAELEADCDGTTVRTTVTACVTGQAGMSAAIGIIQRVTDWITKNYTSQGGIIRYVIKGDTLISASFVIDDKGYTQCNTVAGNTNPYGGSYVNLDANALPVEEPGIEPQTLGGGGGSPVDDCGACLANACPDATESVDIATCVNDHCAAVCPVPGNVCPAPGPPVMSDCVGAGVPCEASVCCSGLACYANDVGAVCM